MYYLSRLFEGDDKKRRKSSVEKIKCLLNYFRRVKEEGKSYFGLGRRDSNYILELVSLYDTSYCSVFQYP